MAASIEKMEFDIGMAAAPKPEPSWEYHLRKYLMLLATLVATATYAAGLSPPGGVWQETGFEVAGKPSHEAGDPILYHSARYLAFFYFNATAFAASLVVNLLLLVLNERRTAWLAVLRFVMVLDLLGLMGAFATGSCEDVPTTVYVSTLVVGLAAYVGVHILLATYAPPEPAGETSPRVIAVREEDDALKHKEQRKVLLLLATFATGISYAAGLNPPGGFRDDADAGGVHKAGDPMLKAHQSARLMAFFYCNTTAFVASLLIIVLLLGRRLQRYYANLQMYGFILVVLLGLLGAYVAGSSRKADTMAYILVLVAAVLVYILLVMVVMVLVSNPPKSSGSWRRLKSFSACASHWLRERGCHPNQTETQSSSPARATLAGGGQGSHADGNKNEGIEKAKSLILLLATLAATITYQAGMDPPGGVWSDGDKGMVPPRYKAGDPILLFKQAARYKAFFYCNSTAFVASLVVILMVQNKSLMRGHALEVAMILDLFGLIGAYAAGSCREVSTSIYVVALAGAVLVYVVIHVVFFTLDNQELSDDDKRKIDKRRKRLLLLAILVATITYQAGLTPPGGFWTKDGHDYSAGSPVLEDHGEYRKRYLAFFYCNSTSFMASMALIVMLVNPNLYRPGIRCYALYVCMVVALFGLMGAYAAGCARQVRTSIYVFVLVGAVVAFIVVQLLVYFKFFETCAAADGEGESSSSSSGSASGGGSGSSKPKTPSSSKPRGRRSRSPKPTSTEASSSRRKYLMLLAILAASVTYQAGLKPPGGVLESKKGDLAGNPVLRESDLPRFRAFFYCNSASFVASVVVIVLLLQESLQDHGLLLYAMNTAIVLDLLGLLGAYAAGSSREWGTSGYVIALAAAVIGYVGIHLVLWMLGGRRGRGRVSTVPELPADPKETRRCSSSPC